MTYTKSRVCSCIRDFEFHQDSVVGGSPRARFCSRHCGIKGTHANRQAIYRESPRRPEVYFKGERVPDVCQHAEIRLAIDHAAIDFDMTENKKYRTLALYEENGSEFSRSCWRMCKTRQGGLLVRGPSEADLDSPDVGKYVRTYLVGARESVPVESRLKAINPVKELTATDFSVIKLFWPSTPRVPSKRRSWLWCANTIRFAVHNLPSG